VEERTGSPEKPFSDLGLVSYRNYWKLRLCYELRHQKDPVTINELSKRTGMTTDDIICGLEALNALVRDPVTGYYALRLDYQLFEAQIERWEAKGYVRLNTKALVWTPYLMGRSQAEHLDHMPLSTIAPRHGVEDEKEKAKKVSEDAARQDTSDITGTTQIDSLENSLAPNGLGNSEVRPADSVNPALISLVDTTTITTTTAESSAVSSPHASSSTGGLLSTLRSIPPTRFEVVPPAHGYAPRRGRPPLNSVFKVTSSRRRTSSPAVSKAPRATPLRSGATPGIAKTIRRGRTKLADSDSAGNDSPVPVRGKGKGNMGRGRPIVTKAPRNRSLTAEMSVESGKGGS
jgi:histone acetyltransferase SAS3